jgi:photosystem II stability/assembly factor-like uncharacterized protein
MLAPLLLTLLSTLSAAPTADDARLNDLCFVDARHGWAVGDRGVVWHTDDGGTQWQRQPSGVSCPLWSVCFHNERLGWAAGGFTRPYTHTSTGVVLTTRDGGQTWTQVPKLVLPALRRIGFFDPRHGWALGCRSAMYPSGLFVTDDGGQSWRPLPGEGGAGWLAADFLDPRAGVLAGRNAAVAVVRGGEPGPIRADGLELRGLVQLRLQRPAHGWLVGDGGLVCMTNDLGTSMRPVPTLPPFARWFDFAALAVRGPKCWIAGSPGTRVFHTADAGRAWSTLDTGSTVPLRAIAFVDDQHGWAAGELGTILATADGGLSWRQQRAGGSRAAVLGVFADPDDVPLELLARLSGNEGYLSAVEVLGRRDVEVPPRDDVPAADRLHEAVVAVGGCAAAAAWQFPLRQSGLRVAVPQIVEAWDRASDGHGREELLARVVRQIRLWRPEIIVTHDAGREDDDPPAWLVHQAVEQAVRQAADPNAFPSQIAEAGLKSWQVKRVYAHCTPYAPREGPSVTRSATSTPSSGSRGAGDLITGQFAPAFGRSLADAAAEPRGLLQDHFTLPPPTLGFRLFAGNGPEASDQRDFFGAPAIAPGSQSRRELPHASLERPDASQRIAKKRRHVQAILDQAGRAGWSAEQLLAQIDQLTRDLDRPGAGQVLFQLADQCYRSGRWPAAADTFQAMAERYPEHSLTPLALRWLVQYYASGEAACRLHCDAPQQQGRFERAAAIGRELERTRFEQFAEPAVRFPLAAAYRGLGQARQAERFYQVQSRDEQRDAWWTCAQGELRLTDAKGHPPKPILSCVRAKAKPHLDGQLDDPVWRQAKPAALRSAQHDDADWPATVMLAYDDEFLYIAIRCRQPAGADGTPKDDNVGGDSSRRSPAPRPRDGDLSGHDRVELLLDIDRDYATYYRLAIDHRGWPNESCWGDATWNPAWSVAAGREDGAWTAEAAIPLAAIAGRPPQPRDIWAVGVQRVAPGAGFQSWSTPAAVHVLPDGFGYLVFE